MVFRRPLFFCPQIPHGTLTAQFKTKRHRSWQHLRRLYNTSRANWQGRSSPWENGYNESFNAKLRDELLNREIFYTLKEAKAMIERWRSIARRTVWTDRVVFVPPTLEH
jgi:hypothetical protein